MGIATYVALNLFFIGLAWLALGRARTSRSRKQLLIALAHMVVLTAIFDSLIIAAGIVRYDYSKLLGPLVGIAPLEDFAYAVAAVVFVPLLWSALAPNKGGSRVGKR